MAIRVFLVEDNASIRDSLIEALSDLIEVQWVGFAESEDDAIAAMRAVQWDVALVDLFLKAGSGLGVARAMRQRSGCKLYMLTNYATPDMRVRSAQLGVDAVFDKSVELDALFETLETLASERGGKP